MKAKLGNIEIEGTPEEVGALLKQLGQPFSVALPSESGGVAKENSISEDFAFRVLKRRPLSPEQTALLKALKDNHPSWTTAPQLRKVTRYSANQLSGLLGAFGKRVSSTDGYIEGVPFFQQEWDYDHDCYRYRLAEGSLKAVIRAGI